MNTSKFDPVMIELVLLINRMGYKTRGSCSGHDPKSRKDFYESFGRYKDRDHSLTISKFVKDRVISDGEDGQVWFKKPSHAKWFYLKIKELSQSKFKSRIKMTTKIHVVFICNGLTQKTIDNFWRDITVKFKKEEFL